MASCLSETRTSIRLRVNSFAGTITPLPPHEDCYVTGIAVSLRCRAFSMGPISIRPAFFIEREFSSRTSMQLRGAIARDVCPQRVLQAAELSPSEFTRAGASPALFAPRVITPWGAAPARAILCQVHVSQLALNSHGCQGHVAIAPLGAVGGKPTREHRIRLRTQ